MEESSREKLLNSAAVDPTASANLESSDLDFALPLWLDIVLAVVIFFIGLGVYESQKRKSQTSGDATDRKEE